MRRRPFALVATVVLALLIGAAVAGAVAGPVTSTGSSSHAVAIDDPPDPVSAADDESVPSHSLTLLAAAPVGLQRSSVPDLARNVMVAVAVLAAALVGRTVGRPRRASSGWRPRFLLRFDGAPLRGPPTWAIPAAGI